MISYVQALILGLLQGLTELFPISSLGHSVILPKLLGWSIAQQDPFFVVFLVATHLATALVLVGLFWTDWRAVVCGLWRSLVEREVRSDDEAAKLGWLLVVGTIPVGILGLLLEEPLRSVFASARSAAFFLILNGLMLFLAERFRRRRPGTEKEDSSNRHLAQLSWWQAIGVGTIQAIALIPGFSRSGASMAGGILIGLSNEDAARYSFLLATPVIGAAALLKLPELFQPANRLFIGPAIIGSISAAIAAYLAVRFLLRYFKTNRLTPFALYCVLIGLSLSLVWLP